MKQFYDTHWQSPYQIFSDANLRKESIFAKQPDQKRGSMYDNAYEVRRDHMSDERGEDLHGALPAQRMAASAADS